MPIEPGVLVIPNNNYFPNREGHTPKFVILHGTAGGTSAAAIAGYFKATEGGTNPVSSHYVIGQDGTIVACVDENHGAYANGYLSAAHDSWWDTYANQGININDVTIAIEHVKPSIDNSDSLTSAQQAASFKLVNDICTRWNIPKRAADASGGITGHYSIDPVNRSRCPGTYPWSDLWTFLQGVNVNTFQLQAARDCWNSTSNLFNGVPPRYDSGIAAAWLAEYKKGIFYGPPLTGEYHTCDWSGNAIVAQEFAGGRCEWSNGAPDWFAR